MGMVIVILFLMMIFTQALLHRSTDKVEKDQSEKYRIYIYIRSAFHTAPIVLDSICKQFSGMHVGICILVLKTGNRWHDEHTAVSSL